MTPPGITEKKGEYQIKSSGTSSDGIKITFNKTKKSSGSKSPKHTGYLQIIERIDLNELCH